MKTLFKFNFLLFILVSQIISGCEAQNQSTPTASYWDGDSAWYHATNPIDANKVDLIYLVSTNVVSATDKDGKETYCSLLTTEDRQALDAEFAYTEEHIGQNDFNYIAPYYHQFTFDAINLSTSQFDAQYNKVKEEVCESFDYYMSHINNGRKFALVGFSQGGMLVLDVLKHMTDEQYNQMVAAYAIGYRISSDDTRCRHIVPATDESTPGVTVSYNSVLSTSGIWPFVASGATAAINPVNWKTDATPATFTYENTTHTVHLDPTTNLLIVETDKADEYRTWNSNPVYQSAHVSLDCLHHWDLLFYTSFIHDNILKRAKSANGK